MVGRGGGQQVKPYPTKWEGSLKPVFNQNAKRIHNIGFRLAMSISCCLSNFP